MEKTSEVTELSDTRKRIRDMESHFGKPFCDITSEELSEFLIRELEEEQLASFRAAFPDTKEKRKSFPLLGFLSYVFGGKSNERAVDQSREFDPALHR